VVDTPHTWASASETCCSTRICPVTARLPTFRRVASCFRHTSGLGAPGDPALHTFLIERVPMFLIFALVITFGVSNGFAQALTPPRLRLPESIRPIEYHIELRITPGDDLFSGITEIEVDIGHAIPVLWLNATDLKFADARIGEMPAKAVLAGGDFVALVPPQPVGPGQMRIRMEYTGVVSRNLTDGLFQQKEGEDWYVFSKFEPVTARRAFPCFDEPSFKAPWEITLRVPKGPAVFSNTPVSSETAGPDGTRVVRFEKTRPLPSYLVALAIGPFEVVETARVGRNRVPSRIIVPRGHAKEAGPAAESTPRAVGFLEDYFGIPYPFSKLDQVVVPFTTAWGAVENAGLLAYDQVLLAPEDKESVSRQRSRLTTMVHEMAHQWLGDLVTTAWWDDIWLNEGFASWITPKIVSQWHPEWNMAASEAGSLDAAMNADSLVSARKVRQPIETPGDIGNAFDRITYIKGAAILAMFEHWLGEEAFRAGIRAYLSRYAWRNATSADFIEVMSGVTGRDLREPFSSFLDQGGVPLVKVDVRCDGTHRVLHLAQERYLPIGSKGSPTSTWQFPVCIRYDDGETALRKCVLLDRPAADFPLPDGNACPRWLFADDGATGYYRFAYEGEWFGRLLGKETGSLELREQVALINNVRALVDAGRVDAGQGLSLALRFNRSPHVEVVTSSQRLVAGMSRFIPDQLRPNWARFVRAWLGERARQMGWQPRPGESEDQRQIRLAVVPFVAIDGEDPRLGAEALKLARAWLKNRNAIDPDTVVVVVAAARHGDRAFFDDLISGLKAAKDRQDRGVIIMALGSFRDPGIERAALAMIFQEGVDHRELSGLLFVPWRDTRPIVWTFVQENFDRLNTLMPSARGIPFGATLPDVVSGFCSEPRLVEAERFFKARISNLAGGDRNLSEALESIGLCMACREALGASLTAFLEKY
jgi:alanyl aminopeptidase